MRRFGVRGCICPFCLDGEDSIFHVIQCPSLWTNLSATLPLFATTPTIDAFLLFWDGSHDLDDTGCMRIVAINYLIFTLYNRARFGLPLSRRAVVAALKALVLKWPQVRRLLR